MSRVAVIGEEVRIQGFALAGVITCPAETEDEARSAWRSLGGEVAVVILTPRAADASPVSSASARTCYGGDAAMTGSPLVSARETDRATASTATVFPLAPTRFRLSGPR